MNGSNQWSVSKRIAVLNVLLEICVSVNHIGGNSSDLVTMGENPVLLGSLEIGQLGLLNLNFVSVEVFIEILHVILGGIRLDLFLDPPFFVEELSDLIVGRQLILEQNEIRSVSGIRLEHRFERGTKKHVLPVLLLEAFQMGMQIPFIESLFEVIHIMDGLPVPNLQQGKPEGKHIFFVLIIGKSAFFLDDAVEQSGGLEQTLALLRHLLPLQFNHLGSFELGRSVFDQFREVFRRLIGDGHGLKVSVISLVDFQKGIRIDLLIKDVRQFQVGEEKALFLPALVLCE